MISAQRSRLEDVRGRLQELLQLVDQPLSSAGTPAPDASAAPAATPPPANP
jgi:hypothetical protein